MVGTVNQRNFVQLPELYYAGSPGFDIDGPGGTGAASDFVPGARVDGVRPPRRYRRGRERVPTGTPAPRESTTTDRPQASATPLAPRWFLY